MRTRICMLVFLLVALLFLTSCAAALKWMAYRSDPRGPIIAGQIEVAALDSRVEVIRDKWAIPHIFAETEHDLMRAVGYVHAQDRLFEMDFFRRVATGRLAEVIGDRPLVTGLIYGATTSREQDIGMRILGFEHNAKLYLELAPPESVALLQAYADGVNAYLAAHHDDLPIEFGLIGYQPELWKPEDTIALQRFLGWMLSTNGVVELLRAASDKLLGYEQTELLLPTYSHPKAPRILPNYKFPRRKPSIPFDPTPLKPLAAENISLTTVYRMLGSVGNEATDASNNWAVAGSRTASGYPILANDPHLPHLAPGIFHLTHLSGAGYDVIGATFPGVPLIVLGHNRHVGWAATNNQGDVQDLYAHQVDPGRPERYKFNNTWEDFVTREETVYIKEGADRRAERVLVRVSRFGPVVTDMFARDRTKDVISLRWAGMDFMDSPTAFWELHRSKTPEERRIVADKYWKKKRGDDIAVMRRVNRDVTSCAEYYEAMSRYGTLRQNWVCADTSGHIGYAPMGFVPVRNRGDGRRIARAWRDEGRWIAWVPPEEIPQRMDPPSGYFVSANNATTDLDAYPYPWAYQYVAGYRAARIIELIEAQKPIDAAYIARMHTDVYSKLGEEFVPLFVEAGKGDDALTDAWLILERWDLKATADSAGAALFNVAFDELAKKMLADEMGPDLYRAYTSTHMTNGMLAAILRQKDSPFHDSVNSKQRETWEITYRRALSAAYAKLQQELGPDPALWQWGDVHMLTIAHPLGSQSALADSVNIGPVPHGGGNDTIWASFFRVGSGDFHTTAGPAYRHIVDMKNPAYSWLVLDTGNWGRPLTDYYDDQYELWRRGEYALGLMDRGDIEEHVMGVLVLEPAKLP
ncbi:MAG: penicillin acylase family protein [Candidatus Lernaella stagnicola]|nr:penicillin acylase family protein [Candidatus Lernaella stagnicola]